MIFQGEDVRVFIVFVPQILLATLFFFLIYKMLKRNTNRNSLTLSVFYSLVGFGLVMNGIAVILVFFSPGVYIAFLYFLLTYMMAFSFVFIITFMLGLLKLKYEFTVKRAILLILTYGIIWLLLLLYPGALTYSESWAPIYSFPLYVSGNILFTISFTIPVIYYSMRLRRLFKDSGLKKKLSLFITGNLLLTIIFYGALLYNTWQNSTFRTIWSVVLLFMVISAGLLIYYGIGRDL